MEIKRLPKLKNKNFLESQIRQFTTVRKIIDKLEYENYNKFNQIEFIKKSNLLEKKKQKYSLNNSRIFARKNYTHKSKQSILKKIENHIIRKRLKISKSPRLICCHRNTDDNDFISPLNNKYKLLISSIDYNKRCFRNLSNKDFDSIFKEDSNISKEKEKSKSIVNEKIRYNSLKYKKDINKKNVFTKKNKGKIQRLSTTLKIYNNNNLFLNRIKRNYFQKSDKKKDSTYKSNNTNNLSVYNIFENTNKSKVFKEYNGQFIKDKKYEKFFLLLKKQSDKNYRLINDVKREETLGKDSLLISIAKLNGYKSKKY